jgi:hypothetical protein
MTAPSPANDAKNATTVVESLYRIILSIAK